MFFFHFSSSVFVLFLFSSLFFWHVFFFFRSLDTEHLVPRASDVEAVGRHDYNMILCFSGFCKRGKVEAGLVESQLVTSKATCFCNVFFFEIHKSVLSSQSKFAQF